MKFFIAFSALLAVASASGLYYSPGPLLVRAAIRPAIQQQYHAQDEYGQYSYGYSEPLSAKQEVKTLDGVTRGSYSYRDAEGKVQTVDYTADAGGFRVAATNLPKPVEIPEIIPAQAPLPVRETPEVAAARSAHLAAFEEAKARSGSAPAPILASIDLRDLPRPVEDTPEVARARVEHLNAVENAKLRNTVIKEANAVSVQGAQILAAGAPILDANLRNAIIKETNAVSVQGAPILAARAPILAADPQVRYISSASLPVALSYRSAILPSGFSYSYGLNGAAAYLPASRFVSSPYIQQ